MKEVLLSNARLDPLLMIEFNFFFHFKSFLERHLPRFCPPEGDTIRMDPVVRKTTVGQGCELAFFKARFHKSGLF